MCGIKCVDICIDHGKLFQFLLTNDGKCLENLVFKVLFKIIQLTTREIDAAESVDILSPKH